MRVGIGYSENPDTTVAGVEAAQAAQAQSGRRDKCDFILLFSTARHDAKTLRDSILSVLGQRVPLLGGGAVGAISNDHYGYAGDQVALAAFWLDGVECRFAVEDGLLGDEKDVGRKLGQSLRDLEVDSDSPVVLFYDAIDRAEGDLRLIMATPMLEAMEEELGFLPKLVGAGLQGDYACTPTKQWLGDRIGQHHALALTFSGDIRIDSTIMHGCQPATGYYTVTKSDRQTILEIDGQPALEFIQDLLGPAIAPEEYAFFLIFGINNGDKWGEFDAEKYASRLCLGIDKARSGIVMFEPDMVAGTVFQVMYRSMELDYMAPRINALFDDLGDRKPVFALYIDCAGRAAGYAGTDLEDALVVQEAVRNRAPLLGIYSGVEIAPVSGRPRALDWTGVFCLFSVP